MRFTIGVHRDESLFESFNSRIRDQEKNGLANIAVNKYPKLMCTASVTRLMNTGRGAGRP